MRQDLFEINNESIFVNVIEIDFDTVELNIENYDQNTNETFNLEKIDCFNFLISLHSDIELNETMIHQLEYLSYQRDDYAYLYELN